MIRKVLIANRGEVAVRIIRACREENIDTVAIYSVADKNSLHVQLATESVCIGPARPTESYLNMDNIISAALLKRCDAIHPGYGFLSENPEFARRVEKEGMVFVGPKSDVIAKMGNKDEAKRTMKAAGVPVIPGSDGIIKNVDELKLEAKKIGYPVMLKATAGGGGKGMRIVRDEACIESEFKLARKEALSAFGDDSIYLEKLIEEAKHIEVQLLCDEKGNVLHLGERDCSMQRKNQKLLEEAPCRGLSKELKKQIAKAAIRAAKAVNYRSAGTVEFLLTSDEKFYFMEMNTRLQVEHPVTEMVTGIDIVKEQLRVAAGLPLSVMQDDFEIKGHAIECRINAENIENNFMPSCGRVEIINLPGGKDIRFDSMLYQGYEIPPFYDSMLGKLIVYDKNRHGAIRKMRRALEELMIAGVSTNTGLLYMLSYEKRMIKGDYKTSFLEKNIERIVELSKEI